MKNEVSEIVVEAFNGEYKIIPYKYSDLSDKEKEYILLNGGEEEDGLFAIEQFNGKYKHYLFGFSIDDLYDDIIKEIKLIY